jgi:hypothetical protein
MECNALIPFVFNNSIFVLYFVLDLAAFSVLFFEDDFLSIIGDACIVSIIVSLVFIFILSSTCFDSFSVLSADFTISIFVEDGLENNEDKDVFF